MTDYQYGVYLGMIFSSLPGGTGIWGILVGISQDRWGPILLGACFLALAHWMYSTFVRVAQERKDKGIE